MKINAIYAKSTKEILYSRSEHDFRESKDKTCAIDGGPVHTRIIGNELSHIKLMLDGDYLLKSILHFDYMHENRNASEYTKGYHGKFQIEANSNLEFYKKLIINYEDIKEEIEKIVDFKS